jgi:hypothetical protein
MDVKSEVNGSNSSEVYGYWRRVTDANDNPPNASTCSAVRDEDINHVIAAKRVHLETVRLSGTRRSVRAKSRNDGCRRQLDR